MIRVTIVSAYYNRADHVDRSIESLLNQSHDDYEIIVCDDGSTDGTLARLKRFDDPRLTILSQSNSGFVATMNRMIAQARGAYIAVHGSGDISLPQRIERQSALLDSDDRLGVAGCFVTARGSIYRPLGWDRPGPQPLRQTMLRQNVFSHGEVMFRKDLFDRVGGYRPLFRFAQDRDLWLRIGQLADYAIVPETLYERFNLDGSVSRSSEKVILQKRLSEFAAQCARIFDATGKDPVERLDALSLLLADPSPASARQFARLGLGFARRGDVEGAKALLHAARREGLSPTTFALGLLVHMPTSSPIWKILARKAG